MRQHFSPKPVALAIALSLTPIAFSPVFAAGNTQLENAQVNSQRFNFSIAAGSLTTSLNQIAQTAQLTISYTPALTAGKSAAALQGSFTVKQALSKILAGTDLKVVEKVSGGYTLISANDSAAIGTLATAIVESSDIKNGSSEDSYISDGNTNIGVWKGRSLQETPYSINVVSNDLLKNIQATSSDQLFKMNPVTQFSWPQAQNDAPYIYTRGFKTGTSSRNGVTRDGYDHGVSMADVERVEVLTGMSGFLYGAGNIGGMVNYVSKRPTDERYNAVTLGNTSGSNIYAHGDFGGRIGNDGDFGYRLNVLTQNGETAVKDQDAERNFASLALDWQATDDLLIQVDGSFRDYRINGRQAYWSLGKDDTQVSGKALRPDADDIDSDLLWGQKWAYQDTQTERLGADLLWDITENVAVRAGYLNEHVVRSSTLSFNSLNKDNTYNMSAHTNKDAPHTIDSVGGFVLVDFAFNTGSIEHQLVTGYRYSDNQQARYRDGRSNKLKNENLTLTAPTNFAEPQWEAHGVEGEYFRAKWGTENISVGDDIRFNEQWSTLIGLSYSNLYSKSYKKSSALKNSYDESEVTPSISVVYKPIEQLNTYISYMEGLEQGGTAAEDYDGGKTVINAGEIMKPLISTQFEFGAKVDLDGMLLTAALFEIDKPFEQYQELNDEQYQLVQDGRQVHRGFEFTATGQLTDNVTIVSGFTLLDVEIEGSDATPRGVADKMFKLYGEYSLPAVPGLVLNGGFNYTGDFYGYNEYDTLSGYTLVDIGARYTLNLAEQDLTLRLNVNNLTDHRYWANERFLGDGRRVTLSANVEF